MIRKSCSFRLFLVLIIILGMSGTLYGDETNTSSLLYQAGSFAILEKGEYSEVFSIDENWSLIEASLFLEKINHSGAPVVNDNNEIVGFISNASFLEKI